MKKIENVYDVTKIKYQRQGSMDFEVIARFCFVTNALFVLLEQSPFARRKSDE